ncbi:NmrA family NAD(P)-binding protein [Solwaraspora sp. WMMD1047]|uniref:NmrA family NAD(P)-binding protein n=1 Tax=Solwaraspora sp. WMMD1047 TaxID=3016102 RepID=UPI002416DA70|nr:NmrA family NAD(P)-binding protein [Solwaraspora sp. WMMD1047]MDG4831114.1 NmrA family NAD(P)-binding protein [Solwaraspora sp. WMMD1047]
MQVLVTGATGSVGRHLVAELIRHGARVRALVRDAGAAGLPAGVEAAVGDLNRPETLRPAVAGVDAVFLLWPSMSAAGAAEAVEVLAGPGRHVCYLSAMNVRDDRDPAANGVWGQVEDLVRRSGADWTFLRAGGFATNTLGWAADIAATGEIRWVYGEAGRSLLHERDIAAVAALALTDRRHVGATYVLTGPEVVTQIEQARLIGEAIGRPVRWVELPVEDARRQLLAEWGDPAVVDASLAYWAGLVASPEPVTRAVEEITGAPARSFRQWAVDHADDFR